MSPERKKLYELEMTGAYVFHGTGEEMEILEPRQAHNVTAGKPVKDGPPAVFASTAADYAVFMAVVSKKNCPLGRHSSVASFSLEDGTYQLTFKASVNTLSQLSDDSKGWVYVFDKKQFWQRDPGGIEYTNRKPAVPLAKIEVKKTDLLGTIEAF